MSNRYELFSTDGKYEYYKDTKTGLVGCNFVETMNMLDFQISNLEAKLAELKEQLAKEQKHISRLKNMNKSHDEAVGRLTEENNQIKQQLAEKDEEIAYLTKQVKRFNNEAQKYFEDAYCNDFHNQDKLSFAVEQLEKLRVNLHLLHTDRYLKLIDKEINNQIKKLKEN